MDCLFIVQGEGRGHMTQALALRSMLASAGHRVTAVLVGRSARREVPRFFLEKIGAPVTYFRSPNFVTDGAEKSVRVLPSLLQNGRELPAFRESLRVIDEAVEHCRPDLIVNFFEVLAGIYTVTHRPRVPVVCLAHQYLFRHPIFHFPAGRPIDRAALKFFTGLTALGATRTLALSYYPAPEAPDTGIAVVPPLLRPELFARPVDEREPFYLCYVLNAGYAEEIVRWHVRHPEVRLHCFWDRADRGAEYWVNDRLCFHRLDDERFLTYMARCTGLATTAGFESVSEAMYLGKPVLLVPVAGHFEQHCNAVDAVRAGAGIRAGRFDIDRLIDFVPRYRHPARYFRGWVSEAPGRILRELEAAANREPAPQAVLAAA